MNIPRIVLTQPSHTTAWGIPSGRFVLVSNESTRTDLGEEFLASLIASRQTILQVQTSCSMKDAAEKYHNPDSPGFKQLLRRMTKGEGEQPIYHGPELLLYLHGPDKLATFLLAIKDSQRLLNALLARAGTNFNTLHATKFGVKKLSNRSYAFNLPTLKQTDLNWTNRHLVNSERREFEAATFKSESCGYQPIRAAVNQFKQAVTRAGGKVSRNFDRVFENLIAQANDGDYGIDEFDSMSQSDFH